MLLPGPALLAVGGAGMTRLFDSTLSGNAANFDITGINQTYAHLMLICKLRGDAATTADNANLRLNADSGSNYDEETIQLSNATVTGAPGTATAIQAIRLAGGNSTANAFASAVVVFVDYAGAGHKTLLILGTGVAATEGTVSTYRWLAEFAGWRNTAAINEIALTPGTSGNFVAGSRVTLYGLA